MVHLLLTGAGFSYNWGGPLAGDIFKSILADTGIDERTREMLFDTDGAFETVLADLQASTDPDNKKRYDKMISAVAGVFNGINNAFMQMQFEFENPPSVQHSMASFLSRFHVIFTLNQDALVELHYHPALGPPMNWGGMFLPGMKRLNPQSSGTLHDRLAIMEPTGERRIGGGVQPYMKLHGSVNWVESSSGSRILIMGGAKAVSIGRFPILIWYHEEFRRMLTQPDARLMVIGYGFGDAHINDAIAEGLKTGLKLYIVDPFALDVLKKDPRIAGARKQVIGISTNPLKDTFGGNRYAHGELSRFFT